VSALWVDKTWTDLADAESVCFFPVGAIEQHGPHLPLSTDVVIPERLAQAAAEQTGGLALPVLPFGARSRPRTGGGSRFPGGLFLENETVASALASILADAARVASKVVVIAWHYENSHPVWDGCRRAYLAEPSVPIILVDSPGDLIRSETLQDGYPGHFPGWTAEHAAVVETALMLHLEPASVRSDSIPAEQPVAPPPWDTFPESSMTLPASGVFAPAAGATAAYGRELFDEMVAGLTALA
jgi:creatinine amidohydrolase